MKTKVYSIISSKHGPTIIYITLFVGMFKRDPVDALCRVYRDVNAIYGPACGIASIWLSAMLLNWTVRILIRLLYYILYVAYLYIEIF